MFSNPDDNVKGEFGLLDLYVQAFSLESTENIFKACISFSSQKKLSGLDPTHFLHIEETKYVNAIQYERRKNNYILGRYCAKHAVSGLTGERDLTRIKVKNGIFNQPIIYGDSLMNIQTSLAHSEELAIAAAFDDRILLGVDIEKVNDWTANVAERELTQHERDLVIGVGEKKTSLLLVLWTMKESLSKALKTGLTVPLSVLEVNSISIKDGYYMSTFSNFFQYQAVSWITMDYVFSLVYPKNLYLDMDMFLYNFALKRLSKTVRA